MLGFQVHFWKSSHAFYIFSSSNCIMHMCCTDYHRIPIARSGRYDKYLILWEWEIFVNWLLCSCKCGYVPYCINIVLHWYYLLVQLVAKSCEVNIASLTNVCVSVGVYVRVSFTAYGQDFRRIVVLSILIFHLLLWHCKRKSPTYFQAKW
jgi:hypothetical protein